MSIFTLWPTFTLFSTSSLTSDNDLSTLCLLVQLFFLKKQSTYKWTCLSLSGLFHWVWYPPHSSMLLQMARFSSFLNLNNIPVFLCVCVEREKGRKKGGMKGKKEGGRKKRKKEYSLYPFIHRLFLEFLTWTSAEDMLQRWHCRRNEHWLSKCLRFSDHYHLSFWRGSYPSWPF